jgi:hypothetical protein
MRRFTILSLMGVVLGVAVAAAALRSANNYWAGGLLVATVILMGTAALGAVYSAGRRRAARLGFTVFAAGYFALAFLGLSDQIRAMLPTTWLLTYIHQLAAPPIIYGTPTIGAQPGDFVTLPSDTLSLPVPVGVDVPGGWKLFMPGAANYEAFSVVGHSLFTLLAGLLGMVIAVRCQANQARLRDQAN